MLLLLGYRRIVGKRTSPARRSPVATHMPQLFGGALAVGKLVGGVFYYGDNGTAHVSPGIVVAGDANRKSRLFVLFRDYDPYNGVGVYSFQHKVAQDNFGQSRAQQGTYPRLRYGDKQASEDDARTRLLELKDEWDKRHPTLTVSGADRGGGQFPLTCGLVSSRIHVS